MPTNEFINLPLIEVNCRLGLRQPVLPCTFQVAQHFQTHLEGVVKGPVEVVEGYQLEPVPGTTEVYLDFGRFRPYAFILPDGLLVKIQPNMLTVAWKSLAKGSAYPRYHHTIRGLIKTMLGELEGLNPSDAFFVVNMDYVNRVELQGDRIEDYLAPGICMKGPLDFEVPLVASHIWRKGNFEDFRFEVIRQEPMVDSPADLKPTYIVLSSAGSTEIDIDCPINTLDICHDNLNLAFPELISSKAKREWGLEQ